MSQNDTYKFLPARLVERLRGAEVALRRPMVGARQNQHPSHLFGSSVEFAEYREYYPGDPIQRIDWAVYARTDRYMIRRSYEEVSARSYVLLDISRSMAYQQDGPISKIDYGCYLAAAMMYTMVHQGDSAALITFDDQVRDYFEPTTTAVGLRRPLKHLEEISPTKAGDIESTLHEVAELVRGRALIVIISDLLQDAAGILRGLHHLYHDGKDVTVFHLMDPAEVTLSLSGLADMTDMESQEKLTVNLDDVRHLYARQLNEHLEALRRGCTNQQMDYVFADTRAQVHEVVRKRSKQR